MASDASIVIDFDVKTQQLESDRDQINKILSAIGENTGDKMDDEFKKSADKVVDEAKQVKKDVDDELKKPTTTIKPKVDSSDAQKGTQKVIESLRKLPKEQKVKLDADAKKAGIDDFTALLKRVPKKTRTEILAKAQKGEVIDYEALLKKVPKKVATEAKLNDNASPELKKLQSEATQTESKFTKLKTVIAGTFIGATMSNLATSALGEVKNAIGGVIQQGSEYNRLQQTMNASWLTLTGSASEGKKLVDMTNQLAVSAQNSTEMVNDLNQKFYATTNNADKTRELSKSVLTLQDAFGQSDEAVKNFSTQWSQMIGNGKASAQDMLSIQNVFPKFKQELLEYEKQVTGNSNLTMNKLNDMMSAGKISADTMNTVLINMGKKYKDATKNFGETLDGMERTIRARIPILAGKLVEPFQKLKNPLLGKMSDWVNSSGAEKAANDLGKKLSDGIGSALTFIDKHKDALVTIGKSLASISKTVGGAVWATFKGVIKAIGDVFGIFSKNTKDSAGPLEKIASGLSAIAKNKTAITVTTSALVSMLAAVKAFKVAKSIFDGVSKAIGLLPSKAKAAKLAMESWNKITKVATRLQKIFNKELLLNPYVLIAASIIAIGVAFYQAYKHVKPFRDAVNKLAKTVKDFTKNAWKSISNFFNQVVKATKKIWKEIEPIVKSGMKVISAVIDLGMAVLKKAWSIAWNTISTTVKVVWKIMEPIVKLGMGVIKGVISGTMSIISGLWKGAWNLIKGVLHGAWEIMKPIVKTALDVIADVIKIVTNAIKGNWSGVWNGIKNLFSDVWNGIKSIGSGAVNGLKDIVIGGARGIQSVWEGIWRGVSSFFGGIWDGIKGAARDGINGVIGIINSGVDAIDKVWSFFTGGKTSIPHLGKVRFSQGGVVKRHLSVINDGAGPDWKELVQTPDGGLFMSQERNWTGFLPEGSRVYSGAETKEIMNAVGVSHYATGGIVGQKATHFAGGGIVGDVIDWGKGALSNISSWIGDKIEAIEKFLKDPVKSIKSLVFKATEGMYDGLGNFGAFAKGTWNKITDNMKSWIEKTLKKVVEEEGGANPPGEGVERWRPVIKHAARMLHTDLKDWQINNMLKQIQTESGGNPNIVQTVWDVNMANGNPAQGLLQFIPQTFKAWAVPGHTNIHSGLDQILAAIRRLNAMGTWNYIGHGHGWATGGHVYNKQLAWIAEDGDEFVINNRKANADNLIASAIKQRAEINPNGFSAKIAHIIDGAKFSGSNGYGMAPSASQPSVATHTAQSYEVTDYSQQIEAINRKLDIIAEKQVIVDGRSFAATYEKYGSHERNQRNILERRGVAVDVNF